MRRIDIAEHLRQGRIRELLDLTSRLHGQRMAHDRPLWETWVIEGLADGRIAGRLDRPTADSVLDWLKSLGGEGL